MSLSALIQSFSDTNHYNMKQTPHCHIHLFASLKTFIHHKKFIRYLNTERLGNCIEDTCQGPQLLKLTMESPSVDSSFGAVGGMFWNITTDNYRLRHLLQTEESLEKAPVFVDYMPPSRDGIALPRYVLYILMGTAVIIVALYGIVGHLIKELIHDFTGNSW